MLTIVIKLSRPISILVYTSKYSLAFYPTSWLRYTKVGPTQQVPQITRLLGPFSLTRYYKRDEL